MSEGFWFASEFFPFEVNHDLAVESLGRVTPHEAVLMEVIASPVLLEPQPGPEAEKAAVATPFVALEANFPEKANDKRKRNFSLRAQKRFFSFSVK